MTGHERTFKNEADAMLALALAEGFKGAAGGWIYKPRIEHLTIKPGHSAAGGGVPNEWRDKHVVQSWDTFFTRSNYAARIGVSDDGRFFVKDAERLYEQNREASGKTYAKLLDALADDEVEKAAKLRAMHEGWKVRVFAAFELARGGTVKLPKAERVLA